MDDPAEFSPFFLRNPAHFHGMDFGKSQKTLDEVDAAGCKNILNEGICILLGHFCRLETAF